MATAYPNTGPFKRGSKGQDVKLIQSQLKLYYAVRSLDLPANIAVLPQDDDQSGYGIYGPATEKAVRTFQGTAQIKVDGLVGPNTWEVLFADPPEEEPIQEEEPVQEEETEVTYREYIILKGTVTDDFGDPIGGVKIQYSGQEKGPDGKYVEEPIATTDTTEIPTPIDTVTVPKLILIAGKTIDDPKRTKEEPSEEEPSEDSPLVDVFTANPANGAFGEFQLFIPLSQFDPSTGKLSIIPQDEGADTKVSTKTIDKISIANPLVYVTDDVVIPKKTLKLYTDEEVPKQGLAISNQSTAYDLGVIRLSALLRGLKEIQRYATDQINEYTGKFNEIKGKLKLPPQTELKKRLDKIIEEIKENLQPIALELLQEFGPQILQLVMSNADKNIIEANKTCPDEEKLKEIIARRNRLIRTLNSLYSLVQIGLLTSTGLSAAIQAAKIGLAVYNANPFPTPPAANSAKESILLRLNLYGLVADGLTTTFAILGYILGLILDNLNSLDNLILGCSKDQEIPFEAINEELNNLTDPQLTQEMQRNEIGYKGFTLKVQLTGKDVSGYQSRIGVAYDRSGVAVLTTPPSFTSVPDLLLKQLQVRIDEEDLKAN